LAGCETGTVCGAVSVAEGAMIALYPVSAWLEKVGAGGEDVRSEK
jgi:hypothetical protein